LGEVHLPDGRLEEALVVAQRALHPSRAHQERGHEAWTLRLLGKLAYHRDPPELEPAEGYYGQALALAEELSFMTALHLLHRTELCCGNCSAFSNNLVLCKNSGDTEAQGKPYNESN